ERACSGPLAEDDVEVELLHRRVEDLLDDAGQAVDFVDEQDRTVLEVRQDRREIAGAFDRGPARDLYRDPELVRDHARERGLPHSRRTVERDVLERLVAGLGRFYDDAELPFDLVLVDVLVVR